MTTKKPWLTLFFQLFRETLTSGFVFKRALVALLILTQGMMGALPVHAFELFSVRAEAGLDQKTRDLIERMPKELRDQIFGLLNDALPLIDQSVMRYLAQVDEILATRLSQVQCAAVGAGKTTVEELISNLKPFNKTGPTVVSDLQRSVDNFPGTMKRDATPQSFRQGYADLLNNANTVGCAVEATPVAKAEVVKIRVALTARVRPWVRLEGENCSDTRSCLGMLKARVAEEINGADPRDLANARAKARLDAIPMPKEGFFIAYSPLPYEAGIRETFDISDSLRLARLVREASASKQLQAAAQMLDVLTQAIAQGQSALNGKQIPVMEQAISVVNARRNDKPKIIKTAVEAAGISSTVQQDSERIVVRANDADAQLAPIVSQLTQAVAAQKAAAKKKEEEIDVRSICGKGGGGGRSHCMPN